MQGFKNSKLFACSSLIFNIDVKKCVTSSVRSILCQCASEKFVHSFLMIEFYLPAPYCNENVLRFFSFTKVVKSHWCSKLKETNIEAFATNKSRRSLNGIVH